MIIIEGEYRWGEVISKPTLITITRNYYVCALLVYIYTCSIIAGKKKNKNKKKTLVAR